MQHYMKLLEGPFERIKSGEKTIEIRLFDQKRSVINLGDTIKFSKLPELKEKFNVKVVALLRYNSFKNLITDFGMEHYGYSQDYPVNDFLKSIYTIYSLEKEQQYGVLGIKIEMLAK